MKDNIYYDIFDNSLDSICFLDKDGFFIEVNKAVEKLTGYSKKELIGSHVSKLIHPDDENNSKKYFKKLLKHGKYINYEGRIKTKKGKIKYIEVNSNLIMESGKVIGSRDFIRDITKRKKLESKLKDYTNHLEEMVKEKTEYIWIVQIGFIETISSLAEYRDKETGEHLNRIKKYVHILVSGLLSNSIYSSYIRSKQNYVKDISIASVLHDIGKTAIPDSILLKPGKLTEKEFEIMKTHTTIAGELLREEEKKLRKVLGHESYLSLARDIAYFHHEKWNGTGYPKGLKELNIPLSARIVAVADVYDALTSDRPYKKAWDHKTSYNTIISERGKHFDPEIINAFIENEDKIMNISAKKK